MDRDIMMRWIIHFLKKADDGELSMLMYFIKGYVEAKEKR